MYSYSKRFHVFQFSSIHFLKFGFAYTTAVCTIFAHVFFIGKTFSAFCPQCTLVIEVLTVCGILFSFLNVQRIEQIDDFRNCLSLEIMSRSFSIVLKNHKVWIVPVNILYFYIVFIYSTRFFDKTFDIRVSIQLSSRARNNFCGDV